ncbi:MAG: molybdopterin molybdotransferase MoeA [Lachnospiraceae bacterium]|nr:molybdopterin molybdotransferase MoeA [Lachnospiraceae bacterium]
MLNVITLEEALQLVRETFVPAGAKERVPLGEALGRTLAEDVTAAEYVPDFDRSNVDGYAVRARDTFGCSDAIPAVLRLQARIRMGERPDFALEEGCCAAIPTGGALPRGADSAVMLEYAEEFGDGTVGIARSAAPGENLTFRGDDVSPGKLLLPRGRILHPQDVGALAALGITNVPVTAPLRAAVISTGDELVAPDKKPGPGQVRDVNGPLIEAQLADAGIRAVRFGIVPDREDALRKAVENAIQDCDAVILSGGSSVGEKDASLRVIGSLGPVLFHGLAMKPGKPTILGRCGNKPLIGLPGHPVAAFFVTRLFVLPLLSRLSGTEFEPRQCTARLTENVSANHGRAYFCACRLRKEEDGIAAEPIRTKSGLITALAGADGYFCVDRDCEGLMQGAQIRVFCLRENDYGL